MINYGNPQKVEECFQDVIADIYLIFHDVSRCPLLYLGLFNPKCRSARPWHWRMATHRQGFLDTVVPFWQMGAPCFGEAEFSLSVSKIRRNHEKSTKILWIHHIEGMHQVGGMSASFGIWSWWIYCRLPIFRETLFVCRFYLGKTPDTQCRQALALDYPIPSLSTWNCWVGGIATSVSHI